MDLLAGYTPLQIGVAALATLGAAFVRGLAGFGMAILLVPVLALALPPVEAVLVTNFLAVFIGLVELRRLLGQAERSALVICGWIVLATAPGLLLLATTPPDLARLLIAAVALAAFGAVLMPARAAVRPGAAETAGTGIAAGLLTGFAGMPGVPVVPFYVRRAVPRHIAKASMLLIFSVAAAAGLASGAALGVLQWRLLWLAALLFPLVVMGNWLGALAFGRISDRVWRSFVVTVLGAAAGAALLKLLV
ncbi:sulfite exporter TauE/SafE family protein [Erythrobacteraceae bacterium CFH 75059]|uniref:TSUP family transporter n=1 Tax=Qipengyuania thermophila TaxID=2509361 RepID=UPI001021B746|nr:TSUP family transporter [Qipengyuania thermophila]TCD06572.1 sulfite exporter TauE/SafE family protein [Erythrobacteraceae bacterium CFH 75059]